MPPPPKNIFLSTYKFIKQVGYIHNRLSKYTPVRKSFTFVCTATDLY
jgi:hypothetical protein